MLTEGKHLVLLRQNSREQVQNIIMRDPSLSLRMTKRSVMLTEGKHLALQGQNLRLEM
jgi:hypothetical protein